MGNVQVRVDLAKLDGAFVKNLKGSTATKRCLVIPIDDAHLYESERGAVYLDLAAFEVQESHYGDTHLVKQSLPRDVREAMGDAQQNARPILGNVRPMQGQTQAVGTIIDNDLPF